MAMRTALTRLAPCTVVQLAGALSRPDVDESSVDLVRDIAALSGGPAYRFYAPLIVPDAATAQTMRRQPEIARALDQAEKVTRAVVGVGAWKQGLSTVADALTEAERREVHDSGVRGEIGGLGFDFDGRPVTTSLTERLIGIEWERLRTIEEVIGLVYDARKADAIRAALRGGLVKSLVTHRAVAQALLDP